MLRGKRQGCASVARELSRSECSKGCFASCHRPFHGAMPALLLILLTRGTCVLPIVHTRTHMHRHTCTYMYTHTQDSYTHSVWTALHTGMPGRAGAGIAAVLVEATKFYYVYGWVKTGDEYGVQQVVDMELQVRSRLGSSFLVSIPLVVHSISLTVCRG